MPVRRSPRLAVAAVFALVATSAAQPTPLATLLLRMGEYAGRFQSQFSTIVAEERYVQHVAYRSLAPGRFAAETHRELRSDLLLVRPEGSDRFVEFRDVFEVDGHPVRDRQDRLTKLFLDPSAHAADQIQEINRESARYNIGNVERTINTPTLALNFLLPRNQPRFRFTLSRRGAVIEYEEVQRPTLIRTNNGLDLPAHGRFSFDAESGRILTTELAAEDVALRATIDVVYAWDARMQLMIPAEMRERYEVRRDGAVITGTATYGRVRQFGVNTTERLGPPEPADRQEPAKTDDRSAPDAPLPLQPLPAETRPQTTPAPPIFRAGTELVLVDFVVTDKSDRSVAGLASKDFVVKEDGKEQPIVSFQAFAPNAAPVRSADAKLSSVTPAIDSHPSNGSTIVLVDDLHLTPDQAVRLRPALKGLLTTVGSRSGRLMLVSPASQISALAELPAGAADLSAVVDQVSGQRTEEHTTFPIADAEALAIARRDLTTIARVAARFVMLNPELSPDQAETIAIERGIDTANGARVRRDRLYDVALNCLDWLASRPGRHSLIVVSGGFAADPDDGKYFDVVTRSLRANAPIDFLDARGLSGFDRYHDVEFSPLLGRSADEGPFGRYEAAEGTTGLAIDTGGVVVANTNDMRKGLDELLDSMTTYYVLAYRPPDRRKAGFRKIKVEVRVKGLRVRARTGYFAPAGSYQR